MRRLNYNGTYLAVTLVLASFAVWLRFLPHPPNFTPIAAAGILAATLLPLRYALTVPLASIIVSDMVIGLHPLVLFTWGSFAAAVILTRFITQAKTSPSRIIASTASSSILFFSVTNFGVWLEGRLYERTLAGLVECYTLALPFFRNTLAGDFFYVALLFGLYALAGQLLRSVTGTTIERRA